MFFENKQELRNVHAAKTKELSKFWEVSSSFSLDCDRSDPSINDSMSHSL